MKSSQSQPAAPLFTEAVSSMAFRIVLSTVLASALLTPEIVCSRTSNETGWPMFNGSLAGNRYSPLKQITTGNVASLVRSGEHVLPETTSFQAGPIVVGKTIYVTTATATYALDARTAEFRWAQTYSPKSMGLGTPVRGLAYAEGKLYRGTPDAHLLALNASTGEVVWDVVAGDTSKGEYFGAAPIVWDGRIYLGTAGSDVGAKGRMMAFDAKSGARLWNFDIVPSSGPGAETWPADPQRIKAGGGTYSSYALDPVAGMLYIPTGNPGPDFAANYRPGKNLYTSSVVKLDARTGELKGHYQIVPNDFHDWDVAASPILFTSKSGRKRVVVAGKNGLLYGLNRDLNSVTYKVAVTTIDNADAPLTAEGTHFSPGSQGGVNWNGPSYSPRQNALFVNAIDWGTTITLGGPDSTEHSAGKPFLGSANAFGVSDPHHKSGWLTAIDADSGKILWKYHSLQPLVAGVTSTAGGIVFTGDLDGNLLAFSAASGKNLLKVKAGGPIGGGVVTYSVSGTQYVAVAAGMKNGILGTDSGPASVVIYALPSKK